MNRQDIKVGEQYVFVHTFDQPTLRPEGRRDKHTNTVVTVTKTPSKGAGLITVDLASGEVGQVFASELRAMS